MPLGTSRNSELRVAPSRDEEHDSRDTIRLYKDTMLEDAIEFGDPLVRAPSQQELKIVERVSVYNAGDIDKVARNDKREEERHKWKAFHESVRKYRAGVSKGSSSKGNYSYWGILSRSVKPINIF